MTKPIFSTQPSLSIAALALVTSSASAVLVDFNTPGDLARFRLNPVSMTEVIVTKPHLQLQVRLFYLIRRLSYAYPD